MDSRDSLVTSLSKVDANDLLDAPCHSKKLRLPTPYAQSLQGVSLSSPLLPTTDYGPSCNRDIGWAFIEVYGPDPWLS